MKIAKEIFKFYIAGISTSLIQLGLLCFLTDFIGMWYMHSAVMAGIISVTINYRLNRNWVFNYSGNRRQLFQYVEFWVTRGVSITIQLVVFFILVEYCHLWYVYAAVISIILSSLVNYGFNRCWIFRH